MFVPAVVRQQVGFGNVPQLIRVPVEPYATTIFFRKKCGNVLSLFFGYFENRHRRLCLEASLQHRKMLRNNHANVCTDLLMSAMSRTATVDGQPLAFKTR